MNEQLFRIDSGYFCAGLVIKDGHIIAAAPIIGYMKKNKWSLDQVNNYCMKKRWKLELV